MCGIGGIYGENPTNLLDVLLPLLGYIPRRGPDGIGVGLINPDNGEMEKVTLIFPDNDKKRSNYKGKLLDQALFYREVEKEAYRIGAKFALVQSKYSTRTNVQKRNREALERNIQPICLEDRLLFVHNGEIDDVGLKKIVDFRMYSEADVDSRFLAEVYEQQRIRLKSDWKAASWVMENVFGSFAAGFSAGEELIFFKDMLGLRPLCIGEDKKKGTKIITSESGFFEDAYIKYIREIKNGEMIKIFKDGKMMSKILFDTPPLHCGFEDFYFKDYPSRDFTGKFSCGNHIRFEVGKELALLYQDAVTDLDAIGYCPESGKSYAQGLAYGARLLGSNVPEIDLARKIEKERYFLRRKGHKYSIDRLAVINKNIGICDDSLVRGDTIKKFFYSLKMNGAKKVKFFIGWPPIVHPCNLGIDTPTYTELLAYELIGKQIKVTEEGVKYDITEVNRTVTDIIKKEIIKEMKKEPETYKGLKKKDLADLEIYFGTSEIIEQVLPYNTCKQCYTGICPINNKTKFSTNLLENS